MSKRKFFLFLALAAILALLLGMYFSPANRLIRAIRKGQTEVVARLLEQGVDPNETDVPPGHWTYITETSARRPLCVACGEGNTEIVELLLAYGADPGPREYTGFSPLRTLLACDAPNKEEIAALLISHGADPMEVEGDADFLFACADMRVFSSGQYQEEWAETSANLLLTYMGDTDIDRRGSFGRTYLMIACRTGNLLLVSALLERGADPMLIDRSRQTAFDYAAGAPNRAEVLQLLNSAIDQS